jgi:mRNA interferase RelE/StbE
MVVRVELTEDALSDLVRYAASGNLPLFLKKLLRLEAVGKEAGLPLGGNLSGYRKIVVGDRTWRIVFNTNPEETVATILVIGDRDDAACCEEAQRRVDAMSQRRQETVSLAGAMFQLSEMQRAEKRQRRKRT